jgi:hypothetical protein
VHRLETGIAFNITFWGSLLSAGSLLKNPELSLRGAFSATKQSLTYCYFKHRDCFAEFIPKIGARKGGKKIFSVTSQLLAIHFSQPVRIRKLFAL